MGLEHEDEDLERDTEEEETMSMTEFHQILLQQVYRTINITLGALISYIGSDVFSDLSEEQRDYVFEYVIDTWSLILPQPIDDMWDKQVMLLAFTQQLRNIATQKAKTEMIAEERDERLRIIYKQLGWDFDTKEPEND